MRVRVPRTIGLALLDGIGITWGNGLSTLFFNVPATSRLRSYSFRAMVGMTPPDHRAALAADERPLLTLVGDHDQAFHVDRFPDVIALHQGGRVEILKGVGGQRLLLGRRRASRSDPGDHATALAGISAVRRGASVLDLDVSRRLERCYFVRASRRTS